MFMPEYPQPIGYDKCGICGGPLLTAPSPAFKPHIAGLVTEQSIPSIASPDTHNYIGHSGSLRQEVKVFPVFVGPISTAECRGKVGFE